MNEALRTLYAEHLQTLSGRWSRVMDSTSTDAVVIWAGHSQNYLFDDQPPPFRANPHLMQWLPYPDCEHAALVIRHDRLPRLFFYQPEDYWHLPPEVPAWANDLLDIQTFADIESLQQAVNAEVVGCNQLSSIGATIDNQLLPQALGNPAPLLNGLDYARGIKTPFELACMREATRMAVAGHRAAETAFRDGLSEFDINLAYLKASGQSATELPYGNIVGLNEHAGVLHYQHQSHDLPTPYLSLLIDAGGRSQGYAADITRTYAKAPGVFADLIGALDAAQRELMDSIKPGINYLDLHERMHHQITHLLCDAELLKVDEEQAISLGLSESFFPHGLGHLLGLQTHDVAGQQADPQGTTAPPPDNYPALRLTREIEPGQTFTIEPGIYFIPMLLNELRNRLTAENLSSALNETLLAELQPYGGIRIEDNICVRAQGIENFTRDAFAQASAGTR